MNTLTIPAVDEELHRKLVLRAQANHRSLEAETLCCLQEAIESDETALAAIPAGEWDKLERSVCETIQDRGTPLTDADFQRYREMARDHTRQ